jgi:hypothetical protein
VATDLGCTGCVAAADLATDSVEAAEIATSAVGTAEVNDNTLTASDLADSLTFASDTSFAIVSGTAPTVDTAGEVAVDTTNNQLLAYGGALSVLDPVRRDCLTIDTPVDADNPIWFKAVRNITVSQINCVVAAATSAES